MSISICSNNYTEEFICKKKRKFSNGWGYTPQQLTSQPSSTRTCCTVSSHSPLAPPNAPASCNSQSTSLSSHVASFSTWCPSPRGAHASPPLLALQGPPFPCPAPIRGYFQPPSEQINCSGILFDRLDFPLLLQLIRHPDKVPHGPRLEHFFTST